MIREKNLPKKDKVPRSHVKKGRVKEKKPRAKGLFIWSRVLETTLPPSLTELTFYCAAEKLKQPFI